MVSKEQAHYLTNVMRLKEGDVFHIFNENGEYEMTAHSWTVGNKVKEFIKTPTKALAFSLIKSHRMNTMIEKVVEMGATHLYPLTSQHSQFPTFKKERYEKIIIEAAEQCGRLDLPICFETQPLKKFLAEFVIASETKQSSPELRLDHVAVARDDGGNIDWFFGDFEGTHKITSSQGYGIIIGPEGGFSKDEITLLQQHCKGVKLHNNILRAETAAIIGMNF